MWIGEVVNNRVKQGGAGENGIRRREARRYNNLRQSRKKVWKKGRPGCVLNSLRVD